jgi:hypothetical protein
MKDMTDMVDVENISMEVIEDIVEDVEMRTENKEMLFSDQVCIFIASHISNSLRIPLLMECLASLFAQTTPVAVYLGISFETADLMNEFMNNVEQYREKIDNSELKCLIQAKKTAQMRHFAYLYSELSDKHNWVLFCDDDDTYQPTRVEEFITRIENYVSEEGKPLVGLYESTFKKTHTEHRHEFWCYCVNMRLLGKFYKILYPYPDVLDNKCCDILFAEYLRRSPEIFEFIQIEIPLYNYRLDNTGSVTDIIKANQTKIHVPNPPKLEEDKFSEYIVNWDNYLCENIDIYLHDTYLRTITGTKFDDILRAEFRGDYPYLEYVDSCHSAKLKQLYDTLQVVCHTLYYQNDGFGPAINE